MTQAPPFRKIFDGVATREQMFELFNRVPDCPCEDRISGRAFENSWFEIESTSYEYMLEMLPPLFMRAGMFAMSELKAGFVGSVFFEIVIGRSRWFTGYCNLGDRHSPDAMRAAIIEHETTGTASLSRDAKLDLIWARTPADYRGLAGETAPDSWPPEHHGKRVILVHKPGVGTVRKFLDDLTDDEITARLPTAPTT